MKKTTYLVIAIIIVLVLLVGYLVFLFYQSWGVGTAGSGEGNLEGDGEEPEPETTCLDLGCEEDDVYVGSINSDKYYECSCHYAKNILPENIICFKTDGEAIADGRTKTEC